jgi:hypothetical protein
MSKRGKLAKAPMRKKKDMYMKIIGGNMNTSITHNRHPIRKDIYFEKGNDHIVPKAKYYVAPHGPPGHRINIMSGRGK